VFFFKKVQLENMGCCFSSKYASDPDGDTKFPPPPGEHAIIDACAMQELSPSAAVNGFGSHSGNGPSSSSVAEPEKELDFQKEPSGESFHTCISQETALKRMIQESVPPQPSKPRQKTAHFADAPGASPGARCAETPHTVNTLSTIDSSLSGRSDIDHIASCESADAVAVPTIRSSPAALAEIVIYPGDTPEDAGGASASSTMGRPGPAVGRRTSGFGAIRKSVTGGWGGSRGLGRMSRRFSTKDGSSMEHTKSRRASFVKRVGGQNPNMPAEFLWLKEMFEMIVKNETFGVGSLDRSSPHAQATSPVFIVFGSCPSSFAPMQAIMFSAVGKGSEAIDFWWVKPVKNHPEMFERSHLDRWAKGPNKNDPGRSKSIYKPLGDLFVGASSKVKQDFRFGMEFVAGTQRAFIEDPRQKPPSRYYLYFVWQEEWTTTPWASNKFLKGKIAYQREPQKGLDALTFLREFCVMNDKMELADREEPITPNAVLPLGSSLKELGALQAR